MSLALNSESRYESFFCGERVEIRVQWRNETDSVASVPDPAAPRNIEPRYRLLAAGQEERVFCAAGENVSATTEPQERVDVAPGETLDYWIPINDWTDVASEGEYALQAQATHGQSAVSSQPTRFTVEKPQSSAFALGFGFSKQGVPDLYGAWLPQGKKGKELIQRLYAEKRPDTGEVSVRGDVRLAQPGANATEPFSPWTNYSRWEDMINWIGWREGKRLYAQPSTDTTPLSLDLPSAHETVVFPALMSENARVLDVFLVGEGGRQLRLSRFPAPLEMPRKAPQLLWSQPLAEPPSAIRAALSPSQAGNERVVVWLAPQTMPEPRLAVYCLRVGADGKPGKTEVVHLKNAYLMPNTVPGIEVDAQGRTQVAFLYLSHAETHKFALAEVGFPANGNGSERPHFQQLGALPSAPRACAATYRLLPNLPAKREWVVLLRDGGLVSSLSAPSVQRPAAAPLLPLELLALSQTTYLLSDVPHTGPSLIALHP